MQGLAEQSSCLRRYEFHMLTFGEWAQSTTGDSSKAEFWRRLFDEHPEFFRLDTSADNPLRSCGGGSFQNATMPAPFERIRPRVTALPTCGQAPTFPSSVRPLRERQLSLRWLKNDNCRWSDNERQ
jgi:hypothetical protein